MSGPPQGGSTGSYNRYMKRFIDDCEEFVLYIYYCN